MPELSTLLVSLLAIHVGHAILFIMFELVIRVWRPESMLYYWIFFFFSFRFLLRLIIYKMSALTSKSKGLIKKPLQLLGQHSNWMVLTQQRLFYACIIDFVCLPALFCLYDHEVNIADYFMSLLELSSNNSGKLACVWKKFQWHSLAPSCKVAGTCGIYSISGIFEEQLGIMGMYLMKIGYLS